MTLTYLTFNKEFGDLAKLVVPAEPVDPKTELRNSWTLWVQTSDNEGKQAEYKDSTRSLTTFKTVEVCINFVLHVRP